MAKMVPTYTKHIDTINKIGDLAYRAGHTKDIETAMVLMDSVLSAIPYLGPLALLVKGILSIFMSTESELKLVMNKLGEMNRKLDRIYDRVTEAIGKIESVAIESSFKTESRKVHALMAAYRRYVDTPTTITRDAFVNNCNCFSATEFVQWIERELTTEDVLPLSQVMLKEFDLEVYNKWTARISSMIFSAVFLHAALLGASSEYSEEEIERTLTGDDRILSTSIRNIKQSLAEGERYIKRKFPKQAKVEIERILRDREGDDNSTFIDHLIVFLNKKYPWRLWSITSWNATANTYSEHHIRAGYNVWYWHKQNKRCLLVGSVKPEMVVQSGYARKIASGRESYSGSAWTEYISQHLEPYVSDYACLAVVRHGNGLWASTNHFFENGNYGGGKYSVIAIPKDSSIEG